MTDTVDRKANKNLLDENLKPGKLCVIRSNYTQTRQSLTKTSHVSGKSHPDLLQMGQKFFEIVSKGQLISELLFDIFNFQKKQSKKYDKFLP